jgi:hypothetical protein
MFRFEWHLTRLVQITTRGVSATKRLLPLLCLSFGR